MVNPLDPEYLIQGQNKNDFIKLNKIDLNQSKNLHKVSNK